MYRKAATAAVPHDEGGALGRGDQPAGPPDVQRLAAGATQDEGELGRRRLEPARPLGRLAGEVGAGQLLVATMVVRVAGDQDPGDRAVTGQPPARLRPQRLTPTHHTAEAARAILESVEIDGDQQLRADPTGPRELAGFEVAAGQLDQGISPPLIPTPLVLAIGRTGQRIQRGQHDLAALRVQQPLHRDHAIQGRGRPEAPARMTPFGVGVGPVGVGGRGQIADGLAEPGRIELSGRLDQCRFGLHHGVRGQVVGAVGQHLSVGGRQIAVGQRLAGRRQGAAEAGPGGPDRRGRRPGAHPQPPPQPAGGGAFLGALFGPGGAAAVDGGQGTQPLALLPVDELPQGQAVVGQGAVSQAVQVHGGQPLDRRLEGGQPVRRLIRMCVRVHVGNLSSPPEKASTNTSLWINRPMRCPPPEVLGLEAGHRRDPAHWGEAPVPGGCMGPDNLDPRAR